MLRRSGRFGGAFTIAELLIALAITALLLAAVAVAFNAAATNYRENENIFRTINGARQALSRIVSQLRTAESVDPTSPSNECTLITADGKDLTYRYNSTDKKLYLVTNDDLFDADYVLCDNVSAMTLTKDTGTRDGMTYVKEVQISMTVSSGNVDQTLSAAVVIRRNLP